jgi:hypothetical protein
MRCIYKTATKRIRNFGKREREREQEREREREREREGDGRESESERALDLRLITFTSIKGWISIILILKILK